MQSVIMLTRIQRSMKAVLTARAIHAVKTNAMARIQLQSGEQHDFPCNHVAFLQRTLSEGGRAVWCAERIVFGVCSLFQQSEAALLREREGACTSGPARLYDGIGMRGRGGMSNGESAEDVKKSSAKVLCAVRQPGIVSRIGLLFHNEPVSDRAHEGGRSSPQFAEGRVHSVLWGGKTAHEHRAQFVRVKRGSRDE